MSSNEKQPLANPAAQQSQQYFPPPPPGPPPVQTTPAGPTNPPKHANETPLPDYDIPEYNPTNPQFAPPPAVDDDIYNASPTEEHPPKWGHHHHAPAGDAEGKKKSNRLSAFGEAFTSKVAGPVNALANKFGSEGFLPESLDKECEKAARILKGFCKDGIYSDVVPPTAPTPSAATTAEKPPPSPSNKPKKSRVLLTIPPKVIARAQGLAIFTAVRVGFQATGSSGSGVLLARLPDGSWSPPSGIQITSIGAGFVAGVDIYDCVIVINTREALDLFTKMRLSLGSDLAVTAGPFGAGGALDWGVPAGAGDKNKQPPHNTTTTTPEQQPPLPPRPPLSADNTHFQTNPVPENQQGMTLEEDDKTKTAKDRRPSPFREAIKKPVYSYVKSRGLFAGVQIDGTVIAAREGANAKFYGRAVPVAQILRGEVPAQGGMWPAGARGLVEVLRGAEAGGNLDPNQTQNQGQGQGRPVSPAPHPGAGPSAGYGGPSPAFGAPAGTGGAPSTAWVHPPAPAPAPAPTTTHGVPDVTAGMRDLGVGSSSSSSSSGVPPPPPAPAPTAGASAKAAEAAAEAARAQQQEEREAPPPSYEEPSHHHPGGGSGGGEDLPPAYVEDERYRPVGGGGDTKTGLH